MAAFQSIFIFIAIVSNGVHSQSDSENDNDESLIDTVLDSYLWALIGGIAVISICCIAAGICYCRKNPRKCVLKLIKIILVCTFLVEDIFALLWESGEYGAESVFYIFWGFAAISGIINVFVECCKCKDIMGTIFAIIAELAQSVLFLIFSSFYSVGLIVFPAFFIFQAVLEIISYCVERGIEDEDDEKEPDNVGREISSVAMEYKPDDGEKDEDEEVTCCCIDAKTKDVWNKNLMATMQTVFWLPFLYYNEDSPFRTQEFDMLATVVLWWASVCIEFEMGSFSKKELKDENCKGKIISYFGMIFTTVWGAILLVMCVGYIGDAKAGFETGYTIFMIFYLGLYVTCMPFFLCVGICLSCCCCGNTKKIEEVATAHAQRQYMDKNGLTTAIEMEV